MAKRKAKSKPCPDCGGSGVIPWGETTIPCANCNGTGKVSAKK